MSGVRCELETILQLATFVPRKRVDSMIHISGRYLMTRPTPPCDNLAVVATAWEHTMPHPRRLCQKTASRILVSVRSIRS